MFKKMNITISHLLIMKFLGRNYDKGYTVRELSRILGLSVGNVSIVLREMEKEGLIKKEKKGNMVFSKANMESVILREFKFLFTLIEIKELLELVIPLAHKVYIFGSCVSGEDKEDSDVDICIVTEKKDSVFDVITRFRAERKLSPLVLSTDEFIGLKKKDKALYNQITSGRMVK
ncbi:MAG: nucleotidyltransferase domain-containing protein [Candidatus Anstonellales archaeon]